MPRARPSLLRSLLSRQSCFVDTSIRFFLGPFVSGTSPDTRHASLSSLFRCTRRRIRDKNVVDLAGRRALSAILRFYRITINTSINVPRHQRRGPDTVKVHASISIASILSRLYAHPVTKQTRDRVYACPSIF